MVEGLKKIINPWADFGKEEYNCFGCCPDNPFGLKMCFFEDGDDVVTYWHATENYQSWKGTLHGGIQATLIDELGGWVITRKMQACGVTIRMNVKYRTPAPAGNGEEIEVRGTITDVKRNFVTVLVKLSHQGRVCTEAELVYCLLPEEKAKEMKFGGCFVEE